jgi:MFS family permease
MKPSRRRPLLASAMLIDTLGGGLLAPFELIYALRISHLSLPTAGFILSIAAAAGIGAGPIAGAAVDRIGPVRVVALANVFGALGCVSLLFWTNALGYGVAAFLLSAHMRAFWGAFTPLVASIAQPHELEMWFGRLRAARFIGLTAGAGLSGLAFIGGQHNGLRLLVAADGVSFLLTLALLLLAGRGVRARADQSTDQTGELERTRRGYRAALADRVNLAFAALNVAATLLLIAPVLALPVLVLDRLHLASWVPGVLAGTMTATAAAGSLFSVRLMRGRRRLRNLQLAALFWALSFTAFLFAPLGSAVAFVALGTGALLLGIGEAFYAPTADALPAALAPPHLQGRYAAIHQMAWGISETIAPALAATALANGSDTLWLILGVLALVTAAAYRLLEWPSAGRDGVAGMQSSRSPSESPATSRSNLADGTGALTAWPCR